MTQLIQYDPHNPPMANTCSSSPHEHSEDCSGDCEQQEMTQTQVALWNEMEFCRRAGMNLVGVPVSLGHAVPGFPVEILELDLRLTALLQYLAANDYIDMDELNNLYAEIKVSKLSAGRQEFERAKKIAKKPPIIGLDGKPLN